VGLRIIQWSIISALAGFLFGFDTVVISGAEQKIQALWGLSPAMHGIVVASALYGTVLGSLLGGFPADRFGRRATLIAIGFLYLIGALGSAAATDVYSFIAARVIGGLGIGMSTVAAPLYIAEIAPPKYRGRLTGMFQFNIVFGIVIAYASNALLADVGPNAWRWMIAVAALPSLLYTALCFSLPESPRWILNKTRDAESALRVLRRIRPGVADAEIEQEADDIRRAAQGDELASTGASRALRVPILLAFLIAFFNQMSGINAVLYFAPRIFELAGLGARAALLQSIGVGITNLVFTLVGLWLIDRLGRKTLLLIGSVGYIVSLSAICYAFISSHYSLIPILIFAFIAAHALGQGVTIWVYIAEIFPNRYRAKGQALGSFTHWTFAALLTSVFPFAVAAFAPAAVFAFFAFMMVLQLIWVQTLVVETKGVSLEQISARLSVPKELLNTEGPSKLAGPLCLLLVSVALALGFVSPVRAEKNSDRADWMRTARFGVMTHFLHDWIMHEQHDQMTPDNWNALVDGFDVEAVADQLQSVGAAYYLISIGQNSGYYLAPNATYDRLTGITPSRLSHRDLVADLAAALSKRGIKLMVYLPSGAPASDAAARAALKWKNGPYRNAEFERNWQAIIREWSLRWGSRVVGWWFDGVYWPNNMYRSAEPPNFQSFAAAARAGNPHSAVAFNPGQVNRALSLTPYEDYIAGEIGDPHLWSTRRNFDGLIDGAQIHFLSHLGTTWGQGTPRFSTEEALGFSRKVAEVGGVVTWDTPAQRNGTFAPEYLAQLKAIGEAIRATPLKQDLPADGPPPTPTPPDGGSGPNPSSDQRPANAREAARAEAPAPGSLPGRGLAQHDFICAGQWDTRNPLETATLVRGGKVVWTFTIPDKNERNETAEFSDIHLLSNGNLLYAHKTGAAEVTPDKKLVWSYIAPPGTEVHSAQPIGLDRVFLGQNGFPAKALLINKRTGRIEMEHELETKPKPDDPQLVAGSIHGQFRHIRMTKAGTYLIPHLNLGKVREYDRKWKQIFEVDAPSAWTAVRLPNGNTLIGGNQHGYVREVNPKGATVWEIDKDDLPGIPLYTVQEVSRLKNGNTLISNWGGSIQKSDWEKVVQYIEVAPDKKVVWALHQWKDPDLGPGSLIQVLDEGAPGEDVEAPR